MTVGCKNGESEYSEKRRKENEEKHATNENEKNNAEE